jgi:protein ImuA
MPGVHSTRPVASPQVLERLREQLAALSRRKPIAAAVETGWMPVDRLLPDGGLARGAVHEWIGTDEPPTPAASNSRTYRGKNWTPPLALFIYLVERAQCVENKPPPLSRTIWIGPAVWPYPPALWGDSGTTPLFTDRVLFVRAVTPAQRVWAAELVLRSRTATAAIVDGAGFDLTATRRLQLAAENGAALCLLARPPWEVDCPSAAATRWLVRSSPSPKYTQRWTVELLRCKGVRLSAEAPPLWTVERHHATRHVLVVPNVVQRSDPAQAAERKQRAG